ncbi:hypothetical protein AB0K60_00150 [Thermopolyspora sp. NPDC052614]|uniref:hypothetical protein n=1 Tax=Thermopolyspora sp. NPDC052614 TaxID=3155682 RepID=UPI00343C02A1
MSEVGEKAKKRPGADHRPSSPAGESAARTMVAAQTPEPAEAPGTARTYFAVVNADGSLARGFHAVSSQRFGPGLYEVIFAHDVSRSAYIGVIGGSGSVGIETAAHITVVGRSGVPNGVFVTTTDSSGTYVDRGFHLAVHT